MNKFANNFFKFALGFLLLTIILVAFATNGNDQGVKQTTSKEEWFEDLFSAWDGDCKPVKEELKDNYLKDPSSYEMIECSFKANDDSITVKTKFYSNNSFGGRVVATALAVVDKDGTVTILAIEE